MKRLLNKTTFLFLAVVLFLLGIFYWYELRPSIILKQCGQEAKAKTRLIVPANNYFRFCLVSNGLSPQSLFVSH
jgi:hypothetical protein